MRKLLTLRLDACPKCRAVLMENVALIVPDDGGSMTDQQITWALSYLGELHLNHTRC